MLKIGKKNLGDFSVENLGLFFQSWCLLTQPKNLGFIILGNEEILRLFTWVFISLMIRGFELVTRRFELVTHGFELVTRGFELVNRGFELALLNFKSCFKAFNS